MAPPHIEEDFDDLDDVLDEFQTGSAAPAPAKLDPTPQAPASITTPSASATTPQAPSTTAAEDEDFPDPDEAGLDEDDEEIARELEKLMSGAGLEGTDAEQFQAMMQDLMKNGLGGLGGEDDEDLLAALSAGGFGGPAAAGASKPKSGGAAASGSTSKTSPPAAPLDFQSTIAASLSKMKESSSNADAKAEEEAASENDPLAAMMAQMAGLGDENPEGLQAMLDEMMQQLVSKEMLYEPLKDMDAKFPNYLATAKLSDEDRARYVKQQGFIKKIVARFSEPGADEPGEDEATKKARREEVAELIKGMNECGSPPQELMGDMPPGMELGPDGMPTNMPADCTIS